MGFFFTIQAHPDKHYTNSSCYSHKEEPIKQLTPPPPPIQNPPKELQTVPNTDLEIGSMVEVSVEDDILPGVIRWIGKFSGKDPHILIGVELTEKLLSKFDTALNLKFFECAPNRALYVKPDQCTKDTRFIDDEPAYTSSSRFSETQSFGQVDCPVVEGPAIAPKSRTFYNHCLFE